MPSTRIQLVVFDMAGTTVRDRSEVEHCFANAARRTGLEASTERIKALQGLPKLEVVHLLWEESIGEQHPEYADRVSTTYAAFRHDLEEHYQKAAILPTDGALEAFAWLRAHHIHVALTTGFYRKVADLILRKLGWDSYLDPVTHASDHPESPIHLSLTPDETGQGRPHPDMILRAMKFFDIRDPKSVVKVGDTPSDLQAGARAGVGLNVGVTNGTHTRTQLTRYPHHRLIGSLLELPDIIASYEQAPIS